MKKNPKIKEMSRKIKDIPVFYSSPFYTFQGLLNGVEDVETLYKTIKPCTCGGKPECLQTECMGDFDFTIYCDNPNCEREITRSCYDFDVTPEQDEIALAIRDWNDGLSQDDIDLANEKERNRLLLTEDDFNWKPIYANNLIQNGQDGWYAILHAKKDGKFYVCKWSILFQREELEPMYQAQDAETESYILFMERYFDLAEPIIYPEPSNETSFYDVNEYGSFVRAYKTLEEAKSGAIARCGWQGINKDTLEVIS